MSGVRDSHNPSDCLVLTHSLNRCISDFANASSKFLAPLGTSDMPRTLDPVRETGRSRK